MTTDTLYPPVGARHAIDDEALDQLFRAARTHNDWLDRQVPGALLRQAVDLSDEAQIEAMKMMRPALWEYQIAAKMVYKHAMGGSEAEAYAPIVGAGPNSTALHYDKLSRKIQDGDIVVIDVGAQYSGYTADITRTIPANGKFTPRQREIYEIVLGAQNAALAAMRPGESSLVSRFAAKRCNAAIMSGIRGEADVRGLRLKRRRALLGLARRLK